jgi:amino acid transporter
MNFLIPNVAYAASGSFNEFVGKVDTMIINPLIVLLFALAIVFFLFGMMTFLMNGADEEKRQTGKNHMLWGIVGITIMIGVWTILGVLLNTLGISRSQIDPENGTVNLPEIKDVKLK